MCHSATAFCYSFRSSLQAFPLIFFGRLWFLTVFSNFEPCVIGANVVSLRAFDYELENRAGLRTEY